MPGLEDVVQSYKQNRQELQAQAQAKGLGLDYIYLLGSPLNPEVIKIIPFDVAKKYRILAYSKNGDLIKAATDNVDPGSLRQIVDWLAKTIGLEIEPVIASAISMEYGFKQSEIAQTTTSEKRIEVTAEKQQKFTEDIKSLQDLKAKIASVSTTKLMETIFAGALKTEASDIHLEPSKDTFRIRYRIDGVLQDVANLPITSYKGVLSRIKYLAGLKLDVKNPQNGRFQLKVSNEDIDVRVASLPVADGESIEMRILTAAGIKLLTLDGLGFNQAALATVKEAVSRPHGMILNTGPTGSGKTTTLYAILNDLNKPGVKIITLEDPIEYRFKGIQQVQIEQGKLDFALALKSTLRQDPDIVMIGEIRDPETAQIGIQAAMTGHLVLSTLHTNNAPAAYPRLLDIGVPPFLLAGAINLIISQRLVRLTCRACAGRGCEKCNQTGFKGRTAIIEYLKPTPGIEKLISQKASIADFVRQAKADGMKTMEEDGMEKVSQGLTTKEEILRVTKD